MTAAPVNVFIPRPAEPSPEWHSEEPKWLQLNHAVGGNSSFYPLTVKAFYVFGIMLAACRSVSLLLGDQRQFDTTYFPAYAVFSGAIDLLGRCLRGNSRPRAAKEDLTAGFQWLSDPDIHRYSIVPLDTTLITTHNSPYTIATLVSFRNFAAHGQASSSGSLPPFDYSILGKFPPLLSRAMETYWSLLLRSALPCELLGAALVTPYRNRPVFETLWAFHGGPQAAYPPIGDLFAAFDWQHAPPPIRLGGA